MPSALFPRQRGVSLIEFMIAVLVTALGVLGAAALQLNAVKFNQTASVRSQASLLSYDIVDRMRANRQRALSGSYDIGDCDNLPAGNEQHQNDLSEWCGELQARLPSGNASVARDGNIFTITVSWDEGRLTRTREAGTTEGFVFVTDL